MKATLQSTLLLALMLVAGCGTSHATRPGEMPDWVKGVSSKYPLSRYITGVGQANAMADAKDRARADLAKTFQVAVAERSSDYQQYLQTVSGGQSKTESSLKIERNVQTATSKVLEGVEIAEVWFDDKTQTYYALAVLERQRARAMFSADIKRLDQATRTYISQAQGSRDKLLKAAYARLALETQVERAGVQRSLQVVDKNGTGSRPQWSLARMQSDLLEQLGRIRIRVVADPADDVSTRDLVAHSLGETGIKVVGEGEQADYVLTGQLLLESQGRREGWYWYRGTLIVSLDDASGKARGSRSWAIKEAATDSDLAKRRVIDKVTGILDQQLLATLLNFAIEESNK